MQDISAEEFLKKATPLLFGREIKNSLILFEYKDTLVKNALWELKFHGNTKVAKILALCIHDRLIEELGDQKIFEGFDAPIILPIPVSKNTLRKRGWNQCEILLRELEKIDGGKNFKTSYDSLFKKENVSDQIGKTKEERLKNIKGCFGIKNTSSIAGKNVIILDDVITTGATIEEAKRIILSSGAKKVFVIAVAH